MRIIVTRKGTGKEEDPFRPNIETSNWSIIKEIEEGYEIEIKDDK